ncbi:cation-transporting P-type ATPase [Nitrobacter sp. TKz-YC01]|uniref:cation-transporting P-type ATPase n=1 Tax=Nitrobacter sp. TKz-YC01 TaxID=3398703 RepID=UPI003A101244
MERKQRRPTAWSRDPEGGLTGAEAERRLFRYGPNLSVLNIRRSLIIKFGRRIAESLIAILLIAALISGAVGDWQSLIVIVLIVVFSIALDVVQEQKAENTVEVLRRSVAVTTSVLRDGRPVELAVPEIVPGDVVEFSPGVRLFSTRQRRRRPKLSTI